MILFHLLILCIFGNQSAVGGGSDWSASKQYWRGDYVVYDGYMWSCENNVCESYAPDTTSSWKRLMPAPSSEIEKEAAISSASGACSPQDNCAGCKSWFDEWSNSWINLNRIERCGYYAEENACMLSWKPCRNLDANGNDLAGMYTNPPTNYAEKSVGADHHEYGGEFGDNCSTNEDCGGKDSFCNLAVGTCDAWGAAKEARVGGYEAEHAGACTQSEEDRGCRVFSDYSTACQCRTNEYHYYSKTEVAGFEAIGMNLNHVISLFAIIGALTLVYWGVKSANAVHKRYCVPAYTPIEEEC